jgi:hypothetical protein
MSAQNADRIRLTAAELKAKWFSPDASGMIHDHQTGEVVVQMQDGAEYACTFEEHAAELSRAER